MCANSRDMIWSKNADVPRPMASTTKLMTSLLTLEELFINRFFNFQKFSSPDF